VNFTENQLQAVTATGNLLVVAAAGAGKTGTLVERCTRLLLRPDDPIDIRQMVVVTFTEAAAAEVRERIRTRLENEARKNPSSELLQKQLTYIDSAHISTLHSFCFQLIRQNVLQLELDPAVSVLEPQQAKVLFLNTLDLLLQEHYEGRHDFSGELKTVIQTHFGGWDKPVRNFVEQLHEFTQTRPAPERWFADTEAFLSREQCPEWHEWYNNTIREWCNWWLPYLRRLSIKNAQACASILEEACAKADLNVAAQISARDDKKFWDGRKEEDRPALARLFGEATFLSSLQPEKAGEHPLDEDWKWMRQPLLTLLRFARQFASRYHEEKLDRGVLDFHDLEQFALQLLVDPETQQPTGLAREWQEKFKAIFVDEYQDINGAQDLILSALSSEIPPGNRFLVGDMKQSIYRFRQADPRIFRKYLNQPGWQTIHLSENFRSHEGILNFVNPLFTWLMQKDLGGLDYDAEAALKFGGSAERSAMRSVPGEKPPVELHVLLSDEEPESQKPDADPEEDQPELEEAEQEARLVAGRLRQLTEDRFVIHHQGEGKLRAVEWRDMIVLLRAAKNKVETYAKAFAAAGVPLQTKRNAFFTTQEVLDLCNLLHILDNPLQDIPLVGVLRSPLVGLNDEELASIRIESEAKLFWDALHEFRGKQPLSPAGKKIRKFLDHFARWRDARRCASLGQRLDAILVDTGYADWLLTQPRGRERAANVQQLLRLARQFDESRGQSLYLFLRHIEELQDAAGDIEPAGAVEENAVRLMTVHQSKGLEFPVVAVADLGKRFNLFDRSKEIVIHEKFGLCSKIKPPHTGQRYPSLPQWLARRSDGFETIGEEMRVLYVALTRAQNHLLLFGSATKGAFERWSSRASINPLPPEVCRHQSWLDWLGVFTTVGRSDWTDQTEGITNTFTYKFHTEPPEFSRPEGAEAKRLSLDAVPEFLYVHENATRQAAKTSVTALRKKGEDDEEITRVPLRFRTEKEGTERGLAIHTFLEHFRFSAARELPALRTEAQRLVEDGLLTAEQRDRIDFEAITAFWNSDTGRELLRYETQLHRELPFAFKATRTDLRSVGLADVLSVPEDEFIVIQGVADLVRITPDEIWLIDFKSDRLTRKELPAAIARYQSQVLLYSAALSAIYKRPVTRKGIFFLSLKHFEWLERANDTLVSFQQLELYI
jgi:ATP-dependent helicase/nuclease subunit A